MISKRLVGSLLLCLLAFATGIAGAKYLAHTGTLCSTREDDYFTCQLQGTNKIVSVCAGQNSSPDEGYVQYRYGTRSKLEFKYPADLLPPRGRMSIVDVSRLADGLGSHLKFRNGEYEYVVSNALVPGEVYVAKGGKVVFDKVCKGGSYIPFSGDARRGLPYGASEPVDALDLHAQ